MVKKIVVGYDGTSSSAEAVLWAANEAVVRKVPLRMVACYDVPAVGDAMSGFPASEVYAIAINDIQASLNEMRDVAVAKYPQIKLECISSPGPASVALLTDVTAADLIVMGASSHHGKAAFWLGSTPRSVIHHSPCPVVIVRGAISRGRPDRVVVGIDGSEASERAVRWAADEAGRHQVELLVAHGWWYPYVFVEDSMSQARDLTRVDAEIVLDKAVGVARDVCATKVTHQLVEAGPASALLDTVRDGDLLVLGSHGHGAITAGLIGSTVNSVLERSAVPVVVVT